MAPLLSIDNLRISFDLGDSRLFAVRGLSLDLDEGTTLGLVGESGCGKSVTAFSILRLIDQPGSIDGGTITYRGENLLALDDAAMREIRGGEIAMIFRSP